MNILRKNLEGTPIDDATIESSLKDSHWLAKRLGISYDMARAMGRKGLVPTIRIGKRLIKYEPESIARWIESNIKEAKS